MNTSNLWWQQGDGQLEWMRAGMLWTTFGRLSLHCRDWLHCVESSHLDPSLSSALLWGQKGTQDTCSDKSLLGVVFGEEVEVFAEWAGELRHLLAAVVSGPRSVAFPLLDAGVHLWGGGDSPAQDRWQHTSCLMALTCQGMLGWTCQHMNNRVVKCHWLCWQTKPDKLQIYTHTSSVSSTDFTQVFHGKPSFNPLGSRGRKCTFTD